MGKREKILLWIYGIFLFILSIKASFWGHGGDFKIYLGAAELLNAGKPFYHVFINTYADNGLPYLYSPFFAFLLIPFTFLPYQLIYFLWSIANVFFLYRIYKLLCTFLNVYRFNDKYAFVFLSILIVFSTRYILYNFSLVQVTFLMLYCCLEGIYLLQKKSNLYIGSSIIALGISIKIMPVVLLPYLIARNKFKAFFITILFVFFFSFIPSAYIGVKKNASLLREWWTVVNPSKEEFSINESAEGEGVHSLSALIPTLLKPTQSVYNIGAKRNIANLNDNTIRTISNAATLALTLLTLLFLRYPLFQTLKDLKKTFYELSYICLIIPLIFPHQQKYAFIFILPAVAYVLDFLLEVKFNKEKMSVLTLSLLTLSFIFLVLSTDGVIGVELYHLAQYFKIITYGTLIMVLTLWRCRPAYSSKSNIKSI